MRRFLLIPMLFVGCVHRPPGPLETAEAYAGALKEGRQEDARALLADGAAELPALYPDEAARRARAAEIEAGSDRVTLGDSALTLVRQEEGWRVVERAVEDGARQALESFVDAAEAGDFQTAWSLLAEPLRVRYTPERLAEDFRAEPLSTDRLQRARAALAGTPEIDGELTLFPIGEGRAVRLRREAGGYRILALE